MHFDVIGAAIAGPAAALKLALMGHNVTVWEARPEDDLASAGILGITHGNWDSLRSHGVDVDRNELPNGFRDYSSPFPVHSPFRYITWTGLHVALSDAGKRLGVSYAYGQHVTPNQMLGNVVEATGVSGAVDKLPHSYSGITIYRGQSRRYIGESFLTYREDTDAGEYLTIGDVPGGAFWAYFVPRPGITQLRTTNVMHPPDEYLHLPAELRGAVADTGEIFRSPISDWQVPEHMTNANMTRITIGDVNGPIRPVTTSGANLAIMEGFGIDTLLNPWTARNSEVTMLRRRAFDLALGMELDGPEIGGVAEDVDYYQHHGMLFPGSYA